MTRYSVKIQLAAMMFFQYAVWGAWAPILGATLASRLNATGVQIGWIFGILWLACIITPFIGGQIVDRYLSSDRYMAISAAICTFAAFMMASQKTLEGLTLWMWVWSLAFAPTLGIANSIVFHNLTKLGLSPREQETQFSYIRTAGTVGWIVSAFVLSFILSSHPAVAKGVWAPYEEMYLTAGFGAILTVVSFLLPRTPPSSEKKDPWAFTKAFRLFSTVPGFTIFMIISFFAATEFQFYYVLSGQFMESPVLNIPHALVSPFKSIAQMAEIVGLGLLTPLSLKKFGLKWTLVIGTLAWPLRYFIYALQKPAWLVLASNSLHGIGFAFVFVTSYIYIDRVAPKDIRASAQSLFTLVTLGLGNFLGSLFCGQLKDHFTENVTVGGASVEMTHWPRVFMVPGLLCLGCALAFALFFKEPAPARDEVDGAVPAAVH